ncbi:MAG: TldD/PmbA family protein [bacterium]|nr:TldD/PmbA family protein [bacterium]
MMNLNANQIAETILDIAKKNNCGVQLTMVETDSKDINVREGKVEHLLTSIAISTGVRLFKDNKSAIISFSGDDFEDMETKIKTAVESLGYLGEDEAKRLLNRAEFGEFGEGVKELKLDDHHFDGLDIGKVVETLKGIENAGLGVSDKITPAEQAEFSASRSRVHLFSSEGLARSYLKSYYSYAYSAVAESGGLKEVESWYENKRSFSELSESGLVGKIGKTAAERALKRLGGKKIASGERPVVFTPRTASTLLTKLCYALDGEDILLRNSFLVGKLGQKLFNDNITVIDDPLIDGYIGSYPFDGEGMNGMTKAVIEKGKLHTYLHNSYSAAKLGMALTGNASRTVSSAPGITYGNFYLESGKGSREDLLHEMKDGLLVEDLFTSGMNDVTGDFSFGCAGFLVEKGKVAGPIKEITIAGNILDLFSNILEIADDNDFKRSLSSSSFLVSKLAVAGI